MTTYRQLAFPPCCETSFSVINKSEKNILNDIFISRSKIKVDQRSSCLNITRITIMAAALYNYNNNDLTRRNCHV